jgi:antitoxin ParD1/3/4
MKTWVEEQVAEGGYSTPSEFVRQLLRAEQQRQMREQIDRNLLKALDSGAATDLTAADWDNIRQRVFAKKARRKK